MDNIYCESQPIELLMIKSRLASESEEHIADVV